MTCFFPDTPALTQRLACGDVTLVMCFCAAWCDTCKEYQPKFESLAAQHSDTCFVWVDIEDHPELLGDEDVENFPTIAIVDKTEAAHRTSESLDHRDACTWKTSSNGVTGNAVDTAQRRASIVHAQPQGPSTSR